MGNKKDKSDSPILAVGEVHLWWVELDCPEPEMARWEAVLSCEEIARANRFHFLKDRRRWIAARGQLRIVLSRYFSQAPEELTFSYQSFKKPFIASPHLPEAERIAFNISHSENVAVFAVVRGIEVGVDVEKIRNDIPIEELADICLSPSERITLINDNPAETFRRCFECWVCKEAYLKVDGKGLMGTPPQQLIVTFPHAEDSHDATIREGDLPPATVSLVPTYEGFVCAVAGRTLTGQSLSLHVKNLYRE
jgi:4'-phosphopantetheinyl transferase